MPINKKNLFIIVIFLFLHVGVHYLAMEADPTDSDYLQNQESDDGYDRQIRQPKKKEFDARRNNYRAKV